MHKVKAKGILPASNGINIYRGCRTDVFTVIHAVTAIR